MLSIISKLELRSRSVAPLALFLLAVPAAFAQLERVGPVNPATGYPVWYQDKSGLTLEFCSPLNPAELIGGWCVLLPGDTTAPENINVAGQFSGEHFYFLANAAGTVNTTFGGGKAKLIIGIEGAFGGGAVLPGDQITFARVRAVVNNLPPGDYKVYHPYGVIGPITIDAGASQFSGRLFVTQDVGLACPPGQFDCALAGAIGPFLLPSNAPGGAELPATPNAATGRLYIADPARLGSVTGSPSGQNYFRVVQVTPAGEVAVLSDTSAFNGPGVVTDFNLAGRIFTGAIPGRVTVDRTVYTRDSISTPRVDVFASVFPTVQARIPAGPKPLEITANLDYFYGPCNLDAVTGVLSAPIGQGAAAMRTTGHVAWGQSSPGLGPVPQQLCVEDKTSGTFYQPNVTDDVRVTQADYDPANGIFSLTATSSDKSKDMNGLPIVTLTLVYPGGKQPLVLNSDGTYGLATPIAMSTPPSRIQVTSNMRGTGQGRITTKILPGTILLTDTVTAQNLIGTTSGVVPVTIAVPNSTDNIITIVSGPTNGGTATVGGLAPDGTGGFLSYTPRAGATVDTFTYTLTSSTNVTSNTATASITITSPVPPPPVTGEAIVVSSAGYRIGQTRWTVNGTDTLSAGQVLTIVNNGSGTTPRPVTIGSAVVTAGTWTMDIRGVASSLAPAAGDRIVAVNGNVTPSVTSAGVTVSITK